MPSNPVTILLVDDEISIRDVVKTALASAGHEVLEASSFDEGFRLYQQHLSEIVLLVTDIALPGNNGYELAAQISSIRPNIKVIFMSGHAGRELCKFYYMAETDPRLLKKPFEIGELLRLVNCALESGASKTRQANSN